MFKLFLPGVIQLPHLQKRSLSSIYTQKKVGTDVFLPFQKKERMSET